VPPRSPVACEYGVKNRVLEDCVVVAEILVLFAEVKNKWSSTSTLPIRLHGVGRENLSSLTLFMCLFIYSLIHLCFNKRRSH